MENIDNTELENLIEFDESNKLINEEEFLNLLKCSQLFVPVDLTKDTFKGVSINEQSVDFDIMHLTGDDGQKAVPMFTNLEILKQKGIETSTVAMHTDHLAFIMLSSDYDAVVINPFIDESVEMTADDFINLFDSETNDMTVLDVLKKRSEVLEKDTRFFLRSDSDFMKNDAVDGVYVTEDILNVNSTDTENKKYLNVLEMPKSSRILYIGDLFDDVDFDVMIAPESRFEYVGVSKKGMPLWRCVDQPFFK